MDVEGKNDQVVIADLVKKPGDHELRLGGSPRQWVWGKLDTPMIAASTPEQTPEVKTQRGDHIHSHAQVQTSLKRGYHN